MPSQSYRIPFNRLPPSAATGGTFNISDYTITYANGVLAVNTALTDQVLSAMQNIQYYSPPEDSSMVFAALPAEQSQTAGQGNNSTYVQGTSKNNQQIMVPNSYGIRQQTHLRPARLLDDVIIYVDPALVKLFHLEYLQ